MTGPFNAEVYAELQPEKQRELETMAILQCWRDKVGAIGRC